MDNEYLPGYFTIELNGSFVVPPKKGDDGDGGLGTFAKLGDKADAAVFMLSEGILASGERREQRFMGCLRRVMPGVESLVIFWFDHPDMPGKCHYTGSQNDPIIEFGDRQMIAVDNGLRAVPRGSSNGGQMKIHWQKDM